MDPQERDVGRARRSKLASAARRRLQGPDDSFTVTVFNVGEVTDSRADVDGRRREGPTGVRTSAARRSQI